MKQSPQILFSFLPTEQLNMRALCILLVQFSKLSAKVQLLTGKKRMKNKQSNSENSKSRKPSLDAIFIYFIK